jgi:hypothetical protein
MATTIQDGTGTKFKVKINSDNRLLSQTISESEFDNSVGRGVAYNINTEFLTITGSSEVPLLYIRSTVDRDLVLNAWFIGTDADSGTATRLSLMRVYKNPTSGTIISSGTDITPVNRNFGSSNEFEGTAKKGGDGFTVSGYETTPVLYQTQGTKQRNFGAVQLVLTKGSSVVVTYQQYGLTQNDIYTGFQVYLSDVTN